MSEITGAYGRHIAQTSPEESFCAGCSTCELVCALTHDGVASPSCNRIFVEVDARMMYHTILACMHCSDHPCYNACPKKDEAMKLGDDGVAYIAEENCIGCGLCRKACAFDPPRINFVKSVDKAQRKSKKCDLCRERAEGPACVQWCPVRCLYVS
ncbi:MAG: hydrogenase [Oscillospiraceae bacterium]|nr:hydrogenase [Oscillospiraceae bacterium]